MPVCPVEAISTTRSRTRSRYSSRGSVSASSRTEAYAARLRRTRSRTSAYLPSSRAVRAGDVDLGGRRGAGLGSGSGVGRRWRVGRCLPVRRPCNSRYRARRGRCLVDSRSIEQGEETCPGTPGSAAATGRRGDAHDWLPYSFSIVGAQKSGTSTLSTALDRHPQVARAPRKELQFFTREDIDWARPDYSGYRAPRRKPQHLIAGDATPAYLFWPDALERMHDYNPDMRLIAVFRDPLERLFSHWTMLRGRWTTSPDWPEFITEFRPADHADVAAGRAVAGLQAALGRGPGLLRRPAHPRADDLPARAVAVAGVPGHAGRLLRHPRPAHRLPRRRRATTAIPSRAG